MPDYARRLRLFDDSNPAAKPYQKSSQQKHLNPEQNYSFTAQSGFGYSVLHAKN